MPALAYLEEPYRKTLLTEVTARRGRAFLLDRCLYAASRREYRHPAPGDRGHLLVGGEKRKIDRVYWREGELRHEVSGEAPPPERGERANCHLDWERRHLAMRAHTALHVVLGVLAADRAEILADPEVVGGGRAKLAAKLRDPSPPALAGLVARANAILASNPKVVTGWLPREDLAAHPALLTHVPLAEVARDDPVLRTTRVGDGPVVPCDGCLVREGREVGRIGLAQVAPRERGDVRLSFQVIAPPRD